MQRLITYLPLQRLTRPLLVATLAVLLSSCETLAPLALSFGQNLLATAGHNHGPQYAEVVESLLLALAEKKTSASAQPVAIKAAHAEAPVALDVAILAQRMSAGRRSAPVLVKDGATLRDGRGDPRAGDTLKITFRANCECYVYIIAIDGSGFAEPVFPARGSMHSRPVEKDRQYVVPQGAVWYGLDEYRGTENIYFVASHTRRKDLERIISQLATKKRGNTVEYRSVGEAAVVSGTRGLIKVRLGEVARVQTPSGEMHDVTPTRLLSNINDADLVITRWFHHV